MRNNIDTSLLICTLYSNIVRESYVSPVILVLSDFINLTQVHNFTVSAQYHFTFRRLSVH